MSSIYEVAIDGYIYDIKATVYPPEPMTREDPGCGACVLVEDVILEEYPHGWEAWGYDAFMRDNSEEIDRQILSGLEE